MLKLNASYSKKVPADGEYTSQSYHASIEVELPDDLSAEQLNGKIHETFEMVQSSVKAELHGKSPLQSGNNPKRNISITMWLCYLTVRKPRASITISRQPKNHGTVLWDYRQEKTVMA